MPQTPWPEWALVVATAALVGVTAVLAWFTYHLWKATGALVADTAENAQRQLRAYLSIHGGEIVDQAEHTVYELKPVVRNAGQTPAYDVYYFARARALRRTFPPDFDFRIDDSHHKGTIGALASQDERIIHVLADDALPPFEWDGDAPGLGKTLYLCVYGTVFYRDAFGVDRTTEFSYWIDRDADSRRRIWTHDPAHSKAD